MQATPSLAELQQWLRWVITHPEGVQDALNGTQLPTPLQSTRYIEPQPRQLALIAETPQLTREHRLGVYANAYFERLFESMEADFPLILWVLGEENFRRLSAHYLIKHPSSSPNISDLGEALPNFLQAHPYAKQWPYLPDLARLEWEIAQSMWSHRLPPLDTASLKSIPETDWPKAKIVLDPTVRLLKTEWPVNRLRDKHAATNHKNPPRLDKKNPQWLLLYRDDWVQVKIIDQPRWFALQRLQAGVTLGDLCDQLPREFPDQAASLPVMEWFSHWVGAGVIKKITF
jgi:hypothetical protein